MSQCLLAKQEDTEKWTPKTSPMVSDPVRTMDKSLVPLLATKPISREARLSPPCRGVRKKKSRERCAWAKRPIAAKVKLRKHRA